MIKPVPGMRYGSYAIIHYGDGYLDTISWAFKAWMDRN